jgi:hypothetical protein
MHAYNLIEFQETFVNMPRMPFSTERHHHTHTTFQSFGEGHHSIGRFYGTAIMQLGSRSRFKLIVNLGAIFVASGGDTIDSLTTAAESKRGV